MNLFSTNVEKVCVKTVESGSMTKKRFGNFNDKSSKYLTTNQFLEAIDGNLKKKLIKFFRYFFKSLLNFTLINTASLSKIFLPPPPFPPKITDAKLLLSVTASNLVVNL